MFFPFILIGFRNNISKKNYPINKGIMWENAKNQYRLALSVLKPAYPQNVHISDYELQIVKNIFVKDDYSYLTR